MLWYLKTEGHSFICANLELYDMSRFARNHTNLYYSNFLLFSAIKSINIFVRFVNDLKDFCPKDTPLCVLIGF